ncbi:DUF4178 domain-containing protein [Undibacterium sp.]|uniref:DUF4178 domain-containing protein n=1 Tax=Undibacterium sp. TaxID=1914977 RepID=UPI0025FA0F7C|nr:DUF4178 domain-containing protein [Undibacterium sp.]
MQTVSCPGCGAAVVFRSHASVMAVCEYCKTTVLKDADTVKDFGKMSAVLEDYSPLQLGSSGVFGGRAFDVIGRIQLRYSAGMWNEWYLLFEDGTAAWLGDSSGQFTLTTEKTGNSNLPAFADIVVAQTYEIAGLPYLAAEVRIADCIGGQGELPFKVGPGWQARLADFRHGSQFLTLDYSDVDQASDNSKQNQAALYIGKAVTLGELKFQLLRDEDAIKASAGKFRGKITSLNCPACGGNMDYLPGLTANVICSRCHSQLDTSGTVAQVLASADRMSKLVTTLELGAKATISANSYQIIGLMKRKDDENTVWTEYLLYSARAGFLWLIETNEGWAKSQVLADWPLWYHGESATLGNKSYKKLYEYQAKVIYAAGAFNWRVAVGDSLKVIEFESGKNKLAAEISADEITWSLSTPVAADQIRAWFGDTIKADKAAGADSDEAAIASLSRKFIFAILAINLIPLLASFDANWWVVGLAVAAIYYPAKLMGPAGKGEDE